MTTRTRIPVTVSLLIILFVALLTGSFACTQANSSDTKEILFLIPHGWGVNYYLLKDVVDQYGWIVTHAGLTDTVDVCVAFAAPRGAHSMAMDRLISEIYDISQFDAVVIITSTQFTNEDPFGPFLADSSTVALIKKASEAGIPILASCAGVRLLASANLLEGRKVVGSPKYQAEYEEAGAEFMGNDRGPVIDGNIMTSVRGQYNNVANGQALATGMEVHDGRGPLHLDDAAGLISATAVSFHGVKWGMRYGSVAADGARVLQEISGGGFLICGHTFSGGDNADILIIRTDAIGELLWAKKFGGPGTEYAYDCEVVDDGYLITGYTTSVGNGQKDALLLAIDVNGDEIWSQTYGGKSWDVGIAVSECENGYILCGHTNSFGEGEEDVLLVRTDLSGNEMWRKTIGGEKAEFVSGLQVLDNSNFLIAATTNTFGGKNSDPYLIWTDSEGNQLEAQNYHPTGEAGHGFDWCNGVMPTSDGGYALVGHTDCDDLMNGFALKVGVDRQEVWAQSFGGPFYDYGTSLCESPDGSIVVSGATKSIDGNNDIAVTKLSQAGEIVWHKSFGDKLNQWASDLSVTGDGRIVVLGHAQSADSRLFDIVLIEVAE